MTRRIDYDRVASSYASRYDRNVYTGVADALTEFLKDPQGAATLEVGCGTGHWFTIAAEHSERFAGIDPSRGMLEIARATTASLVQARAEALPFAGATFDRVFCINVLHHVSDPAAFVAEAARVLRPGGGLMTIGLDPHNGLDRWWIYEYFPQALVADRSRYRPTASIRDMMASAGLERCATRVVQHLPRSLSMDEAQSQGFLARTSASQLLVLTEEEYDAGVARIRAEAERSRDFRLHADLRLYATIGWRGRQ
jgi:ubiquinone/menaquinone biosynthesis C-methylase UbiE